MEGHESGVGFVKEHVQNKLLQLNKTQNTLKQTTTALNKGRITGSN